ncbi:aminoglycoside phosphotransferase family protein [Streptomyces sp. Act-28]
MPLDDGRPAVVKITPSPDAEVLRHEGGIMATEAMVHRRIASLPGSRVPTPTPLYAGKEFLVVSLLDGMAWDKAAAHPSPTAEAALHREPGAITARLHALTPQDGRFGDPVAESALSARDWRTAFTAMVEALSEDAERGRFPLGLPPDDARTAAAECGYALDEVTEPRLVQLRPVAGRRLRRSRGRGRAPPAHRTDRPRTGLPGRSGRRPVSPSFGGATGPDSDPVAGCAGGSLDFAPALHHRLALHHLHLGLVLVVECGPHGDDADHLASCRRHFADALDRLRALG